MSYVDECIATYWMTVCDELMTLGIKFFLFFFIWIPDFLHWMTAVGEKVDCSFTDGCLNVRK